MLDPSGLHAAEDEPIGSVLHRVVADAKAYAAAEATLWKTVATTRGRKAGGAAAFAGAALLLAGSAITALLVGAILTLAPRVGPGWATVIVVLVALAIAGILAKIAIGRVRGVTAPLGEHG